MYPCVLSCNELLKEEGHGGLWIGRYGGNFVYEVSYELGDHQSILYEITNQGTKVLSKSCSLLMSILFE